ncbi:alpha/beta hydrolase [Pararhizobium sp.]|uniref:alpha/beta hydrolase n=1 Tax=Pararhizobium sp. TaxID=1977563 RepID=UPI0027167B33|nr:alpha/beta hydrolase [Pararhizobium sp.]MDO9414595.1 alpha/beta hydrolase [Pararhizobium sp.]
MGVLTSATGAQLAWYQTPAVEPARGTLLISHGLAEHARRYADFAASMAAAGFHTYAHDHRGHGSTVATDAPIGRFAATDGVRKVLDDLLAIRNFAAGRHPGLPVILLGHSMGGLIALNYAETYPQTVDALAVWNSNFNGGLAGRAGQAVLAAEKMFKGSDVPSTILPKLTFEAWGKAIEGHRTLFDWLSHDTRQVDAYMADPLCGFNASVSMWLDVFSMIFSGGSADALKRLPRDLPIHLVGGGEDPSTEKGAALLWLAARMKVAGLAHVTSRIYDTMRHETLNEIGRESAIDDFTAWCIAQVGAHQGRETA